MDTPGFRVGQRWQDCDKRSRNRVIEITKVDATHVDAKIVSDDLGPQRIGRNTRIAKARMKPTSTGYRLVSEPAAHFWACPKPDCTTPRDEPGDCPVHEIPLVEVGADGFEVT
jgi:hypothetical protein